MDENNNVYSFGDNRRGHLGLGHENKVLVPQEITALKGCDITKIYYWASAAFFLSKDGTVYYSGRFDSNATFYPKKPRVYNKLSAVTKMNTTTDFTIFLDSTGKVHVQFDNQFTNSSHTSADFLTLPYKDIRDIGIHHTDSYHAHAPYVQVLLDNSGKVFFAGLNKGLLDEPLPLPKVKRMTQSVCYGNDEYLGNVFELYDGSFMAVKIYRNSDWDFEITEERILANTQLSKQLKELMDKRDMEDAPIQLENTESLVNFNF
ncbi:RCC1-like domain-containing protein (plasmid) [Legionella sp. D16C41]|uniref:RCC1-like domain-containing protein n=1 Tax=Legionella sp. D16C41 TaxID=3402688 RepID=UPI003AF7220F